MVRCRSRARARASSSTSRAYILTNNHVIDNAQRVEVTLSDKHKYKATVVDGR